MYDRAYDSVCYHTIKGDRTQQVRNKFWTAKPDLSDGVLVLPVEDFLRALVPGRPPLDAF